MSPNSRDADQAFRDQEEQEEVVEIDEHGRVTRPQKAPLPGDRKRNILRDPKGEYTAQRRCQTSRLVRS